MLGYVCTIVSGGGGAVPVLVLVLVTIAAPYIICGACHRILSLLYYYTTFAFTHTSHLTPKLCRDWRYVGTSQDMDLDYEPETAFAPWYLYDDDSVQLIQQQHREPLPPPLPLPLPRPVVSVTGSAGQQQQQQYQHQLPIPGAGHQPPSTSDVDDLIKTNNAYVLFYRLRNEC